MSDFLKHYQLVLTPLSPIHLGIGEDYEVTNYVIDDGFMYVFEPSRVALTEQQRKTLKSSATDLLKLQKFFKDNKDLFKPHAHRLVAVTSGIQQEYTNYLDNIPALNEPKNMQIQRSAYESHTLNNFIPGSAIKGMIRTAVLEALSGNKPELTLAQKADLSRKYTNFEKGLIGSFSSDAMRALKVSDLSAQNNFVASNIQFAINRKKNIGVPSHAPVVRIESIVMGQYRAFTGTSVMQQFSSELGQRVNKPLEVLPRTIAKNTDLSSMAKATNLYHYSRF
ncbi:hypothetical protein V757_11520 [Pelistega indica]|uniref:CRISPR system Cms protein Csm5 n=1 Tax=Pelistega indica TaxID=1414851 RepID=V8FTW0_9BURK|nr:type III-A CRISPR-associated RAMP protein Csm5 [Pelistega indica]ETD67321.1 hypothetical protein V757_11520 [Pelistega indica]